MFKATIEGVLPSGEVFNQTMEGDLVSAFAIKNTEDGTEVEGRTIGTSNYKRVTSATISNLLETVENEENEQEMLKLAVDLINSRLDELAGRAEEENTGHPDVKVTVVSSSEAAEFLKGLLGGK